jgi:hypothetical protein
MEEITQEQIDAIKAEHDKFQIGRYLTHKEDGRMFQVNAKNMVERTVTLFEVFSLEPAKTYSYDDDLVRMLEPWATVEATLTLKVQISDIGQPQEEITRAVFLSVRGALQTISDAAHKSEADLGVKVRVGDGHLTEFALVPVDKILV